MSIGLVYAAILANVNFLSTIILHLTVLSTWRCKPMTATRYASIALSGRVVACGNIIFKPSETTPNILIHQKIAPHLHRIQLFPTFIGRVAQNGGLRHNGLAPVEMHGI